MSSGPPQEYHASDLVGAGAGSRKAACPLSGLLRAGGQEAMIPLHGSDTSHTRRPRDLAHKTRTLGRTSTPRARSSLLSPRKEYHRLRRARLGPPFIAASSGFARISS